ncbi:MAG: hypothetical protein LRY41_03365 [Candidatus Pacebacteria bacterium]|nr:hypothetical protein [Candidatus Paceibacterota bacterium]MCD8528330.1 hypothetical protein [Candidatus Paceibacterota bacterium]MCD8563812.1 hypothetical protein [Candidatus Paceibacterota bacterium]
MTYRSTIFFKTFGTLGILVFLLIGMSVFAYIAPPGNPPINNLSTPLYVDGMQQTTTNLGVKRNAGLYNFAVEGRSWVSAAPIFSTQSMVFDGNVWQGGDPYQPVSTNLVIRGDLFAGGAVSEPGNILNERLLWSFAPSDAEPVCADQGGNLVRCAGCTDPTAPNYDPAASTDNGSCAQPNPCPSGNCTPTAMSGCSARPTSGGNPHWVVACTTPSKNADGTDVTQYEVQEFIHFEGNFLPYTQQYAGNHYQNGEVFMAGGISGTLNPYRGIILRGRGINSFGAGTWTYFEGSPNATYSIDSFANTNINFNQNNASSLNFAVNWNAYAQIRQSAGLPMGRFVIARCPQGSCTITQTFGGGTTTTVTGTLTIAGIYPFTGSNINQNIAFSTLGGNVGDRYVLYFALPGVNPTVGATFQGGSASYRLESFIERY